MQKRPLVFAQLTDLHVGGRGLNAPDADNNLRWALQELAEIDAGVACAILTADLVCAGARDELEQCAELLRDCPVPWYALPANHDLWGETDCAAWEELIGPRRQSVDLDGLRVILLDDAERRPDNTWRAHASDEKRDWLTGQLASAGQPCVLAHHMPMLPLGDTFHDTWGQSNAGQVLELLNRHNVLAAITGHWHRNGEWDANGIRVINTGALAGWQWTGTPPHYCFPTRPGYRLFHYDGELRSFWREGSYWSMPAPGCQVTLQWVGPAHTGGPRPQVHPVEISGKCILQADAYARGESIESVEWSVNKGQWQPMTRSFAGPWSEWQSEFDPNELRPAGELVCCVRAKSASGKQAIDEVPLTFGQRDSSAKIPAPAYPLAEKLFELFYCPE